MPVFAHILFLHRYMDYKYWYCTNIWENKFIFKTLTHCLGAHFKMNMSLEMSVNNESCYNLGPNIPENGSLIVIARFQHLYRHVNVIAKTIFIFIVLSQDNSENKH